MYREVSVIEVRELLRVWMSGVGLRRVARTRLHECGPAGRVGS
ncbi:hypothetical protein DE4576_04933 [Mycobacterium marinum]|nr:hypothetical protein DE4576_04933 [Mycobacterium marinum]